MLPEYRLLYRFGVPPQRTFHIAFRNVGGSTVDEVNLIEVGNDSIRWLVRAEGASAAFDGGSSHVQ